MTIMLLRPHKAPEHFFGRALDGLAGRLAVNETLDPERIERERPDLLVTTAEIWDHRALCVEAANRLNIPTLYVLDGLLDWRHTFENQAQFEGRTFLQPLLSRKIALPGKSAARLLAAWGYPKRAEVAGLPRVDAALEGFRLQPDPKPSLLAVTPNTWALNPESGQAVEAAMKDLAEWAAGQSACEVFFRIQPELAERVGVPSVWREPLYAQLARARAVLGPPTTVLLEAMAAGLPAACLDYQCRPALTAFAWTVSHRGALEPTVRELLDPPPERMAYQRFLLDEQLRHDGKAGARLALLMERLAEEGARAAREGRPPQLERSFLDEETPEPSAQGDWRWAKDRNGLAEGAPEELRSRIEQMARRQGALKSEAELWRREAERNRAHYHRLAHAFPVNFMLWCRRRLRGPSDTQRKENE